LGGKKEHATLKRGHKEGMEGTRFPKIGVEKVYTCVSWRIDRILLPSYKMLPISSEKKTQLYENV